MRSTTRIAAQLAPQRSTQYSVYFRNTIQRSLDLGIGISGANNLVAKNQFRRPILAGNAGHQPVR